MDSEERRRAIERLTMSGLLACPESLPIAARSAELVDAIRNHQVVIVAGETGSGKSTQLPKLCLAAGRGTNGMIGHTQPRRIAARSIAERVAHELNSDIGEDVGYAVRFTDKVGAHTLVKVMTDGIVLAETQRDRSLRRYDTIIVDEAHERSLNIDFLLGYLHQLLPQRPDLHLVITSATIDTQRFSEHFGDAPIITVEGRTYPVEIRYRPYGEDDDRDQVQAICDAVDELSDDIDGDVLVFLSGEREIHDTADALRRLERPHTEVLPLYARLSSVEQQRIFAPHRGRRIVLSTNVAETSLTVPGIRAVVDAGTARISRYSQRLKVQRLPIEPVSQASANQRSGRCGRVADGICIRLYDEEDFAGRPEFTEPEILRTSLASVILQMTALGLGEVEAFPFIEAPDPRSIRNGYLLLDELGAIRDGRLTKVGRQLARLPVDPRMARMVLEADRHGCVREVMVIAAALSIQDPREYPAEHRQHAEELHRRFRVSGSDFLSFVALWDYLRAQQQQLSGNQFRKLCRSEYLNYLRVREWQDLFSQLRQVAGQLGIRPGTAAGHPDRVHQALLAGLLSHLGHRDSTRADPKRPEYRGAHGSTFAIGRESAVGKNAQWVIAAELVETNRLWGRVVATVQPEWAERLGAHLVRYSYGDPEWDSRNGRAVIDERASLYGLPIVARRTIGYDRVDAADARQMFVRHALVEGDWRADYPFLASNTALLSHMRAIEERTRRFDGIDDDAVHAFYDARVPADIVSVRHFDRWWTRSSAEQRSVLTMTADALGRSAAADDADFPDTWRQGDLVLDLTYRFAPGETDDGVSVLIPLAVLHQVAPDGFDWQVPGYRHELATALAATLPKDIRRQLIPMADTVDAAVQRLTRLDGELLATSLARAITEVSHVSADARDFDLSKVAEHLRITFVVHDRSGTVVGEGKDLGVLRRGLRQQLRAEVARLTPIEERTGITTWDLGTLPREIETERDGHTVVAYPTLVDTGEAVALRIVTSPAVQSKAMRSGLRRLLQLAVPVSKRTIESKLSNADKLVLVAAQRPALAGDCVHAAADAVLDVAGTDVWDEQAFAALIATAKSDMPDLAARALHGAATILTAAAAVETRLAALSAPSLAVSVGDARDHLARLLGPRFVSTVGVDRLDDLERAVRGIERRLAKLTEQPGRDAQRTRELRPLEERYERFRAALPVSAVTAEVIDIGWSLEELRISTFAQALGVKGSASSKRITARLAQLGG